MTSFGDFVERQRRDPEFASALDREERKLRGGDDGDPGAGVPVRPRPSSPTPEGLYAGECGEGFIGNPDLYEGP